MADARASALEISAEALRAALGTLHPTDRATLCARVPNAAAALEREDEAIERGRLEREAAERGRPEREELTREALERLRLEAEARRPQVVSLSAAAAAAAAGGRARARAAAFAARYARLVADACRIYHGNEFDGGRAAGLLGDVAVARGVLDLRARAGLDSSPYLSKIAEMSLGMGDVAMFLWAVAIGAEVPAHARACGAAVIPIARELIRTRGFAWVISDAMRAERLDDAVAILRWCEPCPWDRAALVRQLISNNLYVMTSEPFVAMLEWLEAQSD